MNIISKIYVIGDKTREPDRINYLESYFSSESLTNIVEYFQPTYKDTLTQQEISKYVPINKSLYNRQLRRGEISLFINFIYLFEKILSSHTEGTFLIFESDVLFKDSISRYMNLITPTITSIPYDCISLGSGCDRIHSIVNKETTTIHCVRKVSTRCTDSFIFSYQGIQKFYNYITEFLNEGKSLNQPIDNFMDTFMAQNNTFHYYWAMPCLCVQGSQLNVYTSSVQPSTDDPNISS